MEARVKQETVEPLFRTALIADIGAVTVAVPGNRPRDSPTSAPAKKQKANRNGNGASPVCVTPVFLDNLPAPLEFSGSPSGSSDSHTDHALQNENLRRMELDAQSLPMASQPRDGGNTPSRNPLHLVDPRHVDRYTKLSARKIVATRYYDGPTLGAVGLLDDVLELFEKGGMSNFIELKEGTYKNLTLEFLSTLDIEITRGVTSDQGRLSFRLNGNFHNLTLDEFNEIFGFPRGLDKQYRQVPNDFNPNAFWLDLTGDTGYNPSSSKATAIRNPAIRYAHRLLASGIFARDDSANVVRKSELYFLKCMVNGGLLDPGAFLANQLHTVASSKAGKIVIGGLITPIAIHFGYVPVAHASDRVMGSQCIDLAALEAMRMLRTVEGRLCWIYPNGHPLALPCTRRTSLSDLTNLLYQPDGPVLYHSPPRTDAGDAGAASSVPPRTDAGDEGASTSVPPPQTFNYGYLASSISSIQKEQVLLRDYVTTTHNELRGMINEQTAFLHQIGDAMFAMRDWLTTQGFQYSPSPPPPPHDE